ncbi:AlpA family phage regulatory protein [Pseudoxanthomonas sp. LjRoot125]|uniref:helix-turn-helix transcriptional regulator n=1 Tax=Pseudoxanthomonas sp. LjRoot125 TaxID=3342258 RepID=UPI003E115812
MPLPPRDSSPYELGPAFEFLRSLIEVRVLERLEEIFEHVRRLDRPRIEPDASRRAIRLPEVLSILGICKSTLYSRLNPASPFYDPKMPKPFKLGNSERAPSAWWHGDVIAFLESCGQTRTPN